VKRSLLLVVLVLLSLAAALPALPAHLPAKAATPACAAAPLAAALGLAAPAVSADKSINCTLFCETKNCPPGTTCGLDGKTNKCGCI